MRILPRPLSALVLLSLSQLATAEISFLLQADKLRDQNGAVVSRTTGSWILVADTQRTGFTGVDAGDITVNDFISGDDLVVAQGDFWFVDGTIQEAIGGITLGSNGWDAGDPLGLVWFPNAGLMPSSVEAGESYGFYTNDAPASGSSAWVTPSDPFEGYNLWVFTTDGGVLGSGETSPGAVEAPLSVVPVPEPSVPLLGLLSLGLLIRRKR